MASDKLTQAMNVEMKEETKRLVRTMPDTSYTPEEVEADLMGPFWSAALPQIEYVVSMCELSITRRILLDFYEKLVGNFKLLLLPRDVKDVLRECQLRRIEYSSTSSWTPSCRCTSSPRPTSTACPP